MKVFPFLLFILTIFSQQKEIAVLTEFNAKVSEIRLNAELLANGKKNDEIVSVKLKAIIFKNPMIIKINNNQKNQYEEINFYIEYIRKNIDGSAKDISSYWSENEKVKKFKLISNPQMLEMNRNYFKNNSELKIVGIVFQQNTLAILIKIDNFVQATNMKKEKGKLVLTDYPDNDLEIAIVEASFNFN